MTTVELHIASGAGEMVDLVFSHGRCIFTARKTAKLGVSTESRREAVRLSWMRHRTSWVFGRKMVRS
jgi:Tfp pilus assembly ATPase PilU